MSNGRRAIGRSTEPPKPESESVEETHAQTQAPRTTADSAPQIPCHDEKSANTTSSDTLSGLLEKRHEKKTTIHTPLFTSPDPPMVPRPLLICSLGNPAPTYTDTLHSAGHTVLTRLASYLNCPPLQRDRAWDKGAVTRAPPSLDAPDGASPWILYQSPSFMNVSGKPVRTAYNAWLRSLDPPARALGRLVVLHDELEKPLGKVSVRGLQGQGTSAKGHNGLKSIIQVFGQNFEFVRIGIGIGRPLGRTSQEVGDYVLKKMSANEKSKILDSVEEIAGVLKQLERG